MSFRQFHRARSCGEQVTVQDLTSKKCHQGNAVDGAPSHVVKDATLWWLGNRILVQDQVAALENTATAVWIPKLSNSERVDHMLLQCNSATSHELEWIPPIQSPQYGEGKEW